MTNSPCWTFHGQLEVISERGSAEEQRRLRDEAGDRVRSQQGQRPLKSTVSAEETELHYVSTDAEQSTDRL